LCENLRADDSHEELENNRGKIEMQNNTPSHFNILVYVTNLVICLCYRAWSLPQPSKADDTFIGEFPTLYKFALIIYIRGGEVLLLGGQLTIIIAV